MKLTYEGFSETGMVRSGNQDVFGIYGDGAAGLFLVADGMGGHSQGERASKELKDACTVGGMNSRKESVSGGGMNREEEAFRNCRRSWAPLKRC